MEIWQNVCEDFKVLRNKQDLKMVVLSPKDSNSSSDTSYMFNCRGKYICCVFV